MTTAVILDGAMGKKFGRRWDLNIDSPAEAIRMIECNKPGFANWIRDNLATYENYEVTCQYENGVTEVIGEGELSMNGKITQVRFTPVLTGSGKIGMLIGGIILIAVATFFTMGAAAAGGISFMTALGNSAVLTATMMMGAGMAISGIVGMITPQQKVGGSDVSSRADKTSYYFNGPANTTAQGVPVSLIYGQCLVGSHAISVSLTIDDVAV